MKTLVFCIAAVLAAGCAGEDPYQARNVTTMQPGYGVVLATFKYVPGESKFAPSQVASDARYAADRLALLGYQSFFVYDGSYAAKVGVRASSMSLAQALKKDFERRGSIKLGDGNSIPVANVEITNIAELKLKASDMKP